MKKSMPAKSKKEASKAASKVKGATRDWIGSMAGPDTFVGDVVSPTGVEWDIEREYRNYLKVGRRKPLKPKPKK